jgi:hypothetical protein
MLRLTLTYTNILQYQKKSRKILDNILIFYYIYRRGEIMKDKSVILPIRCPDAKVKDRLWKKIKKLTAITESPRYSIALEELLDKELKNYLTNIY